MKPLFLGNKKHILGLLSFLVVSFAFLSNASAAYPSIISYQGYLTSATGTPQTGTSTVTVRIYDSSTGGNLLYEEVHPNTSISSGTFNISIGSVGDVSVTTSAAAISDLSFSQRYYTTVEIASPFSTGEMTLSGGVRAELAAAPFSITTGGVAAVATSSGLSALAGKLYFNTTDNLLYVHNGTTWNPLSTASSGITSLNGLTGVSQTFAAGTSGTDFNISSGGTIHTFNIPNAGASSRGLISTTTQTIAGNKSFSGTTSLATTTISGTLALAKGLLDSVSSSGNLGQILWSTGTSTLWVSTSSLGITGGSGITAGSDGQVLLSSGGLTSWVSTSSLGIVGITTGNGVAPGTGNTVNGSTPLASNSGSYNTADGDHALFSNTSGSNNTGVGALSLYNNTTGSENSALGKSALFNNTSGLYNVANGFQSLFTNTTGSSNTATGYQSLGQNTTGGFNVANGYQALYGNTTGDSNVAIGYQPLYGSNSGANNVAIGTYALFSNTTGFNNISLGLRSLRLNTTGQHNIALGVDTLQANTSGSFNIGLGVNTLFNNTTGTGNSSIGSNAMLANTTGSYNAVYGTDALRVNTTGDQNVAIGYGPLRFNTTGNQNVALGAYVLYGNTSGINNTGAGYGTLQSNTTGNYNAALGYRSGNALTTGSGNIIIGYDADVPSNTSDNQLSIGNLIYGVGLDGRDTTVSSGNIGIGMTSPTARLDVQSAGGTISSALNLRAGGNTSSDGAALNLIANNGTVNLNLFSDASNSYTRLKSAGNLAFHAGNTAVNGTNEFMTISTSGNVGIGTTTPSQALSVVGNIVATSLQSGGAQCLQANSSGVISGTGSACGGSGSTPGGSSGAIQFNSGGTFGGATALAYDSTNGRLGIGTSSPKFRLDIQGTTTTPSIGVTELISLAADRDFSSNTGNWTGGFTISGGALSYPSGLFDSESLSTSVFTPTVGATYQITFDMTTTSTSMDGLRVRLGDNYSQYIGTTVGSESVTLYVKAESTSGFVFDNTGWHGTIDNISLKLVSGGEAVMALRAASGVSVLEFRTGGLVSSSGDYSYENTFIGKESGRVTDNSGTWNVGFGAFSLSSNTTGDANTSVGSGALTANTTGGYNTAVGFRSLFRNTTGNLNVANGYMTLYSNTTGYDNVAVGDQALKNNTTGTYNIGIGTNALQYATSSSQLVAIGYNALQNNSQGGADNIAIGTNALQTNTIGDGNLAIGVAALQDNTTGNYNVAFGTSALSNNSTGTDNTAIGNSALIFSQTGSSNVAVGSQSLFGLSSGSTNVALGVNTLFNNVSGSRNTAVGHAAGSYISTGSGNLVIGYGADVSSSTGSNQLSIGNLIYGTGLDGTGTSTISSGNIGIGTSTPGSRLDVYKNTGSSNVDIFRLISDVGGASNVKFRVDSDGDVFTDGGTTINSGADVAENYTASEPLEKGDVVALSFTTEEWKTRDPGGDEDAYQISTVRKASNKDKAFGVISTNPGLTLGGNTTNAVPVALSGRIPVKVTLENGDIKAGDLLTMSSLEKGYATKLSGSGQSIGRALSGFSSFTGKSTSTVIVFIENKDHQEMLKEEDGLSELALATSTATSTNLLSSISQIKDALKTNFTVLKSFVTIRLTAAVAYVDTLFARELHAETVCLKKSDGGEVCISGDQIESILGTTTEAVLPLLTPSPSVTTDSGDTPNPPQASSTEEVSSSTETVLPDPTPVVTDPVASESTGEPVVDNQSTPEPEQPVQ